MTVRCPCGLSTALDSERPRTTLGKCYMDGYYKQVLYGESRYGSLGVPFFVFLVLVRSVVPDQREETLGRGEFGDESCDNNGTAYILEHVYSKEMSCELAEMRSGSFTMRFNIRSDGNGMAMSFNRYSCSFVCSFVVWILVESCSRVYGYSERRNLNKRRSEFKSMYLRSASPMNRL
jgi:hypothetical protein